MKKVRIKPGVVLISVCDEHLLVATWETRKDVPYAQQINDAGAFYWKLLEEGLAPKEMIQKGAAQYQMPQGKAALAVIRFLDKLQKAGYITFEDAEDTK